MSPADKAPTNEVPTDAQIYVAGMPTRYGPRTLPWNTSVADSYRQNTIRVRSPESCGSEPVDIVPNPDHDSAPPSEVFGDGVVVAHFISGVNPLNSFSNEARWFASRRRLVASLWETSWSFWPAVAFPPEREWIEPGAIVLNARDADVARFADHLGQDVVLRWDPLGIAPLPTRPGVDVGTEDDPTSVIVRQARLGCPMRHGGAVPCHNQGYWTTSAALLCASVWESHRQMLVDAFGCTVCHGQVLEGPRYGSNSRLFRPTRRGGWGDPVPFEKPSPEENSQDDDRRTP